MNEPSSITAIIVEGGPRSGIWFRSHEDRGRFLQHPDIVKEEGQATTPGFGAFSLQVADAFLWEWLLEGAAFAELGTMPGRFKLCRFQSDRSVKS